MQKETVGMLIGVGVLLAATVVLADTGTQFDGADEVIANSGMKLVYWLMLAAFLGLVLAAMGVHFSPMVIGGFVVVLFVCGVVASHDTIAGMVGVTRAATLTVHEVVGQTAWNPMQGMLP